MIDRRSLLQGGAAALFAGHASFAIAQAEGALPPRSPLGVAATALSQHLRGLDGVAPALRDDPVAYLEYCRSLGAGGVQIGVSKDLPRFRKRLEELGMYYEGQAALPRRRDEDLSAFEASMASAAELGARVVRAVSRPPESGTGRRYESFADYAEYRAWLAEADAVIERCLPIAEKHRVAIALENHKDRATEEHVALLRRIASPWLGALIDPGNNLSLMERPEDTVAALAPWAKATSLKDMGVGLHADGFLLSEVLFDTGMTDQAALFAAMRRHNPSIHPTTELITRDPLKVPIRTERYLRCFPRGQAARVEPWLAMVAARATPLPRVGQLSPAAQFALEAENNRKVFAWGIGRITPAK